MQDKPNPQEPHILAAYDDQALLAMVQGSVPANKDHQLIEATVLEVGDRNVLLNTAYKADGVVSINEFKDMPLLLVGAYL